jgi:hypothetical protein
MRVGVSLAVCETLTVPDCVSWPEFDGEPVTVFDLYGDNEYEAE